MKGITKHTFKIFGLAFFIFAADAALMRSISHFYFPDLRARIDARGIDKESPLNWIGPECQEELNKSDYDITSRYTKEYMHYDCLDRKIKTW